MQVKCSSCGASQDIISTQNCGFCGSIININSPETEKHQTTIINKSFMVNDELSYEDRGIINISDIYSIHNNSELEGVQILNLNNNNIKSMKGLSKFEVMTVYLDYNDILKIDELPKIDDFAHLSLNNNKNLTGFSPNIVDELNKFKDKFGHFSLDIRGCDSFNFSELEQIKFDFFLKYPYVLGHLHPLPNELRIYIDDDIKINIPAKLIEMGFKEQVCKISNSESSRCWLLEKHLEKDNNNVELEEQNKRMQGSASNENKKNCFIATATMGDYNHPVVLDLRLFRDDWLLKRNWGVIFTNWYYKHGPKAAKLIEKSFVLKKITFLLIVKPLQLITSKFRY
jgi:hypothetical protein